MSEFQFYEFAAVDRPLGDDYHDVQTAVLAFSLRERAAGYRSLGFPDRSTTRHHRPPPPSG